MVARSGRGYNGLVLNRDSSEPMLNTRDSPSVKTSASPLAALQVFVTAARELSFARAAQLHGLSPAAVSQAIAKLERTLGVPLFARAARSVSLTPAGARLHSGVASALRDIDLALAAIALRSQARVRVTAPPTWVALWLMPRLPFFARDAPQIQVEVDASFDVIDLEAQGFDIGVRYAQSLPAHFKAAPLFEQVYVPVCTSEIAQRIHRLADLCGSRLLHETDSSRWAGWMAAADANQGHLAADQAVALGLYFSHGTLAVNAALSGMGIALTEPSFLAHGELKSKLVQPLPFQWSTGHRYHAVWSGRTPLSPAARQFLDWLKVQALSARETGSARTD
jgi:LysR family transcriptional regulator, glycine cleavage system transcriptional activator